MIDHYQAPRYIVTDRQILDAVRYAIELSINKREIVDSIMRDVADEIDTILTDDCELLDDYIADMRGE